jgi:predicted outer membrane lipoprotein
MKKREINKDVMKNNRLIHAGFLSVSILAILQLTGEQTLDCAQTISLYSFMIAIPLLAFNIYAINIELRHKYKYTIAAEYRAVPHLLGIFVPTCGITALLWHFSWLLGTLFIIVSIAIILALFTFYKILEKIEKEEGKQSSGPHA